MCGISAIISNDLRDLNGIYSMVESLRHRGPDDAGVEVFELEGVSLGMRRLSVLDVDGGHQPMTDGLTKATLVFNGEIYNHRKLRLELISLGCRFATDHSDTEVILQGYRCWGPDVFARLDGMFAVALYDPRSRILHLARDRYGEKPLYYGRFAGGYLVASEMKSILAHPKFERTVSPAQIREFAALDYVTAPSCLWANAEKLPGGRRAEVSVHGISIYQFSRLDLSSEGITESDALIQLDDLLNQAVEDRLEADVPVGLFLSGGLDSSTVGYYMSRHISKLHSFSIGFADAEFDESHYATTVAAHLGTHHHSVQFSETDAVRLCEQLPSMFDEPIGDQSILPTLLVSQLARKHVTVALGGDGSDELFMGYNSFRGLEAAWTAARMPNFLTHRIARIASRRPPKQGVADGRLVRLLTTLDQTPGERLLDWLGSFGGDSDIINADARLDLERLIRPHLLSAAGINSAAKETILCYLAFYLQEDILVKVDRASMACSLEVRSPFLAQELSAFALRLPTRLKRRGVTGKYLLRRLMRDRLPTSVLSRPKRGFGVPMASLLRGPLRPLVETYLSPVKLREQSWLNFDGARGCVTDHLEGRRDNNRQLWSLLVLQMWAEKWKPEIMPEELAGSRMQ